MLCCCLYVRLHLHTYVMLCCCAFSCTCSHSSCYGAVCSLALGHTHTHTRHAKLLYVLLHLHTRMLFYVLLQLHTWKLIWKWRWRGRWWCCCWTMMVMMMMMVVLLLMMMRWWWWCRCCCYYCCWWSWWMCWCNQIFVFFFLFCSLSVPPIERLKSDSSREPLGDPAPSFRENQVDGKEKWTWVKFWVQIYFEIVGNSFQSFQFMIGLTGVYKIQWEEEVLDQSCPDQFFKTWVDGCPIWMILNISIYRDLVILAGLHQLLRTSTSHTCSGKVGGPRQVLREQGLGLL